MGLAWSLVGSAVRRGPMRQMLHHDQLGDQVRMLGVVSLPSPLEQVPAGGCTDKDAQEGYGAL